MKGFSLRQMRKEYGGALRLCVGVMVSLWLAGACFGALFSAMHTEFPTALAALGVLLAASLGNLGVYLILSDEKRLIRKTPYGWALATLGDPKEIMEKIDQDALRRCEYHGSFTLLQNWLILQVPFGWRFEPRRVCALPIPRSSIQSIKVLGERNTGDPEERRLRLISSRDTYEFFSFQQQDVDDLRRWMEEGERPDA